MSNIEQGLPISLHRAPLALLRPSEDRPWTTDGLMNPPGTIESYEESFSPFLRRIGVETFADILTNRKKQGKSTHVLDLFGGGYFLRDLSSVDSITGARLGNIDSLIESNLIDGIQTAGMMMRSEYEEDFAFLQRLKGFGKREVVEGNLYRYDTWRKIRRSFEERGIPGIDLALCRPVGPFEPRDFIAGLGNVEDVTLKLVYLRLLGQTYDLLSSSGVLFSEVPKDVYTHQELEEFEGTVNANRIGLSVIKSKQESYPSIFMLEKGKSSPPNFRDVFRQLI